MLKKKMKIKNLIISLMFLVVLMPFIFSFDWTSYGNGFTPLWHESYEGNFARFDLGTSNITITKGYSVGNDVANIPFQALVWGFNSTENFVVIANDNYIEIYDENLDLVYEVFSDLVISQIDIADFDGDSKNDVTGVFEYNDTSVSFKSFDYNVTSNSFNLTTEYPISVDGDKIVNGLRCGGGECYFTITELGNTTFYIANKTDLTSVSLPLLNGTPKEPVGWWDFDNDGRTEFFIYSNYSLMLFEKNGNIDVLINASSGKSFESALIFQPDNTGFWRYAVLERTDTPSFPILYMVVYKSDGSVYWNDLLVNKDNPRISGSQIYGAFGRLAIDDDYDGDGYDDIYAVAFKSQYGTGDDTANYIFKVYRGYDGHTFTSFNKDYRQYVTYAKRENDYLAIGDMNGDSVRDFIYLNDYYSISTPYKQINIFDGSTGSVIYNLGSGLNLYNPYSCIPADLTFDGFLDVICSGGGKTLLITSDGTNYNAQINSVSYVPSTSIIVNTTLLAYVSASDYENNLPLYYGVKCSDYANWTEDSTNYMTSCFYDSLGIFNHSVRVRDIYHSDYDMFSQSIYVTSTGVICNNNFICEAEQGENYINCPNDCVSPEEEIPDTTIATGGTPLPTELVNIENIHKGLLPEVYYGTLAFMSSILSPTIVVVFVIFFALIMLTIGTIIKKIGQKVGNMSR